MAETTGLLNRRTGHSVPRVRISSSPQPATAQRFSAGLFWYAADASLLVDDVYRNSTKRPSGRGLLRGRKDPRGRPRDAASAAPRNLVLDILSLGASTSQFASAYILTNYARECADPQRKDIQDEIPLRCACGISGPPAGVLATLQQPTT